MSNDSSSDADPFGRIADEFVEAFRQGKRPSIEDFIRRYPDHAEEIREVLPALVLMEKAKSVPGEAGERRKPAEAASPPLRQVGDYQVLREIGRGGMGVVYEAEQLSLGRHVALKVLPSHALLDPRQLGRFQREARAAARLHHTNIVPVFGVGEQDGLHYYVMQFIHGLGLDQVLAELNRLRQGQADKAPAPPTTGKTGEAAAASVARALLSGTFAHQELQGPVTAAEGEPQGQTGRPPHENGAPASSVTGSSATIRLPGQSEPSALTESGRQYWQSVARVGVQVANALSYAFSQAVLHRDVKPSNLLLDDKGNVWVTDFGLAKADSDRDDLTQTGDIVGTLRYMAPERFNGKGDVRSDIYALGLTLYEMLALRPAYDEADRNKLVKRIMHDEPVRLRKLNRAVPADLETIVLKAVARDPAHRYQTPAEMAEDLQRFVEDRPIRARRVGEAEKFWRWCRRNPLPSSLLGAVVLVFLAGFTAVTWQLFRTQAEREAKEQQRQEAEESRAQAQVERDHAAVTLYYSQLARARLELQANNVTGARQILELCDPKLRGWEWQFLREVVHSELLILEGNTGWTCAVAYSPDGKVIASAGTGNPFFANGPDRIEPGEIILWDAATGKRLHTLRGHKHNLISAAFSPDGKSLASSSLDQTVRLWDVSGGRERQVLRGAGQEANGLAFSPNGRQLAAAGAEGRVLRWDASTGEPLSAWRCGTRTLCHVVFSPDGKWLAAGHCNGEVTLLDASTGASVATIAGSAWDGCVGGPAISPDSRTLAARAGHDAIGLWDIPSGKLRRTLTGHQGRINSLAFSSDGVFLASAGEDSTVRVWNLFKEQGASDNSRVLRGHMDRATVVAFSPDAQALASGGRDGMVRVWDLTRDPEHGDVLTSTDLINSEAVAFDADGRELTIVYRGGPIVKLESGTHTPGQRLHVPLTGAWITPGEVACADAGGQRLAGISGKDSKEAVCWGLGTGKEEVILRGHAVPLSQVAMSADGRRVATAGMARSPEGLVGEVRVWDAGDGRPLFKLREPGLWPRRLALSPDGALLAFSVLSVALPPGQKQPRIQGSFIKVIDVATGRERHAFRGPEDHHFLGLGFSPDGRRLALAGGESQSLVVWDTVDGRELVHTRQAPQAAMDVAFSADGKRIVVAARLQVKLLDADTGEEVLVLHGITQVVPNANGFNASARFSPDGKRLLAICNDSPFGVAEWWLEGDSVTAAGRLQAARRRAVVRLLSEKDAWNVLGSPCFHHDYEHVKDAVLVSPWEYEMRARTHRRAGDRDAAAADCARALELTPGDGVVAREVASLFASLGAWDRAAAAYETASQARPDLPEHWLLAADFHLVRGDRAAYLRTCREMLRQFRNTIDPDLASKIALRCLLPGPTRDVGAELPIAMRLAERSATSAEDHQDYWRCALAKALAEQNAGHFDAAERWLERGEKTVSKTYFAGEASVLLLLDRALIEQHLGRTEAAGATLARATQAMDKRWPKDKGTDDLGPWSIWAHCQHLRREAETRLKSSPSRSSP